MTGAVLLVLMTLVVLEGLVLILNNRAVRGFHQECLGLRRDMFQARRDLLEMINGARAEVQTARGQPVIRVRYLPMDEEIVVMHPNLSLLNAAWENGIGIPTACLGNARCGTCKIQVVEPKGKLPAKAAQEKITLSMFTRQEDIRLSCMIKPRENMVIAIESEQALIDTILPVRSTADLELRANLAG